MCFAMETISATCPVCGGSEYYKECGFYFCSECQTQSQELREHAHELYSTTKASTRAKKNPNTEKEKSDDTHGWTSWEYYNFILKGLVDELIGLGAQKTVKIVVLQLWATYLKKLEVAFTSKKRSRLPKLGINYRPRDAKLVYGCDVEERRRYGRKSRKRAISERVVTVSPVISSYTDEHLAKLHLRKTKKALFEEEYEKDAQLSKHMMSDFDESMRSLETSSRGQVKSDDEACSTFPRLSFSVEARKRHYQYQKKYGVSPDRRIMNQNRSTCQVLKRASPVVLSRVKLLAILYIALQILQDDIQLSDILRWVEEGELSFYEVAHFFPDDVKLRGHDLVAFGPSPNKPSYSGVCKIARNLALYLHVTHLPAPDLLCLARRYIEELQLPAEIVKYVESVMTFSPPHVKFKKSRTHFLNYEGRAMAYIIFVLKLLLGLDGRTEYEISVVTKKLNKLSENSAGAARLFVWEEWVQYIECRKSVFARFHFPTQAAHYQDALNNPNSFIKFWKRMKSKDDRHARLVFSTHSKMNSVLVSAVKRVLMKLIEEETDDNSAVDFVPSLMPQKGNLEAILASKVLDLQCSAAGIPSPADILKQDFTHTTLEHLIMPEQYVAMANMKGIKIVVQEKSAQNQVEQLNKMKKTYQSKEDKTYIIVDTMSEVPNCRQGKKQKRKLMSEMRYKKHNVVVHDTDSSPDRLYRRSRILYNLPVIAENMLVKHLQRNGLYGERDNLLCSESDRTDVRCAESSTSSSEKQSCPSLVTESDRLFQHSEIFSNLPVVAEDMLVRHLEKEGISSELDDQLFHCSTEVDLPLAAKKILLQHEKKCSFSENGMDKNNEFVLYLPFVEYWRNDVSSKWLNVKEFEREVAVELPPSFRWLITECAGMLQMTIQDLYYELLDVEDMCCLFRTQGESVVEKLKKKNI